MIFEILVGRNTPSIRETFALIFGPLRQIGYVPRPSPNMARKYGGFNFSPKVVIIVLNRKLLVSLVYNKMPLLPRGALFDHFWANQK